MSGAAAGVLVRVTAVTAATTGRGAITAVRTGIMGRVMAITADRASPLAARASASASVSNQQTGASTEPRPKGRGLFIGVVPIGPPGLPALLNVSSWRYAGDTAATRSVTMQALTNSRIETEY